MSGPGPGPGGEAQKAPGALEVKFITSTETHLLS